MNSDGAHSLPIREVPASIEAEQALIGSCLLDPYVIDEAAAVVDSDDFFRGAHNEIWRSMLRLWESGRDVNAVSILHDLGARFAAIKGDDLLREVMGRTPHAANGLYFAHIVRSKAMLRRLIGSCNETLRDCYANEATAQEILDSAESRVFALTERESGSGDTVDGASLMVATMADVLARDRNTPRGVSSGFVDLDGLTDGFKPQDLVIVAARPSIGKTAFACRLAIAAASAKVPTLVFSLEMSRASLAERLLSSEAQIPGDLLKRPWRMRDDDRSSLYATSQRLSALPLVLDDRASRSVSQIAAVARRMRSRQGIGLVVIDYLSLIDGQRQRGENRQEEVARISRRLKATARELNCPVICLHQLNRLSEQREGHRPRLSDLRESGQVEQDADMVLLLHRPDYYDANDQPGVVEVIVAKNRNGPTGAVQLAFVKECTRFDSLTHNFSQEEAANGKPY